jgi:hypothetical protein
MRGLPGEIAQFFSMPGRPAASAESVLRRAAVAHDAVLHAALEAVEPEHCPSLAVIAALLPHDALTRCRLLCDPLLVEGLHELVSTCDAVRDWHDCTASHRATVDDWPTRASLLGNTALTVLLRTDPAWCGRLHLRTDCFGLIRFPLSDWILSLTVAGAEVMSDQTVSLHLTAQDAVWMLGRDTMRPFLRMPRALLVQLVSHNEACVDAAGMRALDPSLRPRWELAVPLCPDGVRFLPVHCSTRQSRAATCGGLIKCSHDELLRTSPAVHAEFCAYIEWIMGFDLGGQADGIVQSFSEPTRPRLMGFNVPFTDAGEPRLCPFCTTWLGHELGHTKLYLVGSIGWHEGWRFLRNPSEQTGIIPRYGRSLSVRTLFQVPYTHLYEWTLLMDACEDAPDNEPDPDANPNLFGEDLRAEIEESLERLETVADLTRAGHVAIEHVQRLFAIAERRWEALLFTSHTATAQRISHR